jgi:hypothetical protein
MYVINALVREVPEAGLPDGIFSDQKSIGISVNF